MYSLTIPRKDRRETFDVPSLVQLACSYKSRVQLRNNQGTFDAKSIMGMMSFDFFDGTLKVSAEGEDEEAAVAAVAAHLSICPSAAGLDGQDH